MRSLADFEFNKAPLCEGMILACEAIRRDFPSQDVYDELERLVSLAKEEISQLLPLEEQLEKLIGPALGRPLVSGPDHSCTPDHAESA